MKICLGEKILRIFHSETSNFSQFPKLTMFSGVTLEYFLGLFLKNFHGHLAATGKNQQGWLGKQPGSPEKAHCWMKIWLGEKNSHLDEIFFIVRPHLFQWRLFKQAIEKTGRQLFRIHFRKSGEVFTLFSLPYKTEKCTSVSINYRKRIWLQKERKQTKKGKALFHSERCDGKTAQFHPTLAPFTYK